MGWRPAEFWAATVYEFETAILVKVQEAKPEPWTDAQTMEFFDRLSGAQDA